VLHCRKCDAGWLEPQLRKSTDYYRSNGYRVHIPYDIEGEIRLIRDRLVPFRRETLRDRSITDIGAGNGTFLDVAKALGAETFFTELNQVQVDSLGRRHRWATHVTDFVTLFDVIEHVEFPAGLLRTAMAFMHHESKLVISTPRTTGDIMDPEHFYRTQHTWYFSDKSLDVLCTRVGLFRTRQWIAGGGDNQQLYQAYILKPQ
jgi:2-polyprenyl-3-methyl-5-hydroxy-6-metoxy-1,4-benzoquinol methylase